jgi:hypothetical protein
MIRWGTIVALARAELRLTRRLVRYWVFVGLATLLGAVSFAQFFVIHRLFSAGSASAASANPRFFVGNFGSNFTLMFLLGVIFLGFDLRARDRRDRIVEVLDATPSSNLELVLGRALGLLAASWIPIAVVTGLLAIVAYFVTPALHFGSLVQLLTLMVIPAYVFATGLVYTVTLLVRNRVVAAVVSILLIVGVFVGGIFWTRFSLAPLLDVTGGFSVGFPSDVAPRLFELMTLVQRTGYALMGVGLLVAAAAIHPRHDDGSRGRRGVVAAAVFAAGLLLVVWNVLDNFRAVAVRQGWRAAHEAVRSDPVPDLQSLVGRVDVRPGQSLGLELDLRFRAPADRGLEVARFSLNPGLHVREARLAGGSSVEFAQANGLLELKPSPALGPGQEATVHLVIDGAPDGRFAYLDSLTELYDTKLSEAQIIVLGYEPIEFRRSHVALLPGARWLPKSGPDLGRDDPRTRGEDFFDVDLTVTLPAGWLAAGPGRRQDAASPGDGRIAFRFAPPAPVPDVALVAGRYDSFATDIEGVRLELLVDSDHLANVHFFDDASGEIHDWLSKRLRQASEVGFPYPYDGLTMVEVPGELRGYGGGWRMDSTLIQPAMVLVRESSFPTANFRAATRGLERSRDQEGGIPRAKLRMLEMFFENDLNGGNPFVAVARSFFGFQTSGSGAEAVPLDYVWETLSSELVAERHGFFSVHFFDRKFGQEFALAGQAMQDPNRVSDRYVDVLMHRIVSTNEVWDTVSGVSLRELDPRKDPKRTLNVLALKGGAMADSMLDDLGHVATGKLLGALREGHRGSTYDRAAVLETGGRVGIDLSAWLDLWIDQTELPGFLLGDVRYYRLSDEGASPRYQLRVVVRNDEPADGLVRLEYRIESKNTRVTRQRSEPVRIAGRSAVEIGLVTSEPLSAVRVAPYLALNRDPFNVPLPTLDAQKLVDEPPLAGARPAEWVASADGAIVVDDLDPGFSVDESGDRGMLRVAGRGAAANLDAGLPVAQDGGRGLRSPRWSRMVYADAYGRYRHTMAVVRKGSGTRGATFAAVLPHGGSWEVEYHVPGWRRGPAGKTGPSRGKWQLAIEGGSAQQTASLDADAASVGWNSVGRFDLAAGDVKVRVSDETDGEYVQADAIRFRPAVGAAPAGSLVSSTR